jgi:F-type H+-transporting ATPase subunit b
MQIDLTGFVLELINFTVLVWILHRFLYKPVLAAIDRRRAAVEKSLAEAKAARDEAGTLQAKQALERRRADERRALEQAAAFASRLLERLSGPELDARLVQLLAADLEALPEDQRHPLAEAARAAGGRVAVQSARPLHEEVRRRLEQALSQQLGVECHGQFTVEAALLGGVRVALGPWLLQADLSDELRFFSGGARGAR